MTLQFPMILNAKVTDAATSMYVGVKDGAATTHLEHRLTLRADARSKIVLSSGEHIQDVDLLLVLSSKVATAEALDADLTSNDVGFLCHVVGDGGRPFIHGRAIWPLKYMADSIFHPSAAGFVRLVLSNVPEESLDGKGFVWGLNRKNTIRLESIDITVRSQKSFGS